MDPKFQSSFIPKGPIATASSLGATKQPNKHGLFGFLATAIFVITVVLSIGVFGYKYYLKSSIAHMNEDLVAAKAKLDKDTIDQITRLDSRIMATQRLLDKHIVLTPFFKFLEESTGKGIRFTEFTFDTAEQGGVTVAMKGQARGYASVAFQSELFNQTKYFKNPTFSNLDLDPKGNVTFSFQATIDPTLVSYKSQISGAQIVVPTPVATSTSTPSSTVTASTTAPITKPVATTTATTTKH